MICLLLATVLAAEIPLWPGGAPGSEGKTGAEITVIVDNTRVHNIHSPSLTLFAPEKPNGTAMIIAPGGGHQFLSIDTEGYNVAKYLNTIGVTAFVLKYRLAREPGSTYKVDDAVHDAQRAIRLVRSRAAEWKVDPARVGIVGFSAGGEVAVKAAMAVGDNQPDAADPIDRLSAHPDFEALIYPGIRVETLTITKEMPPTFLLCADNDKGPSTAIGELYPALKKAGVPVEVHIYNSGGHGFGIRDKPKANPILGTWYLRMGDWLGDRGLLK